MLTAYSSILCCLPVDQGQVEHGILWVAGHVVLDLEEVWEVERGGGEAGVGLQQHEAGVRAGVDVQLVVLVPPSEAPPRLLDTEVLLSVSLRQTVI